MDNYTQKQLDRLRRNGLDRVSRAFGWTTLVLVIIGAVLLVIGLANPWDIVFRLLGVTILSLAGIAFIVWAITLLVRFSRAKRLLKKLRAARTQ